MDSTKLDGLLKIKVYEVGRGRDKQVDYFIIKYGLSIQISR